MSLSRIKLLCAIGLMLNLASTKAPTANEAEVVSRPQPSDDPTPSAVWPCILATNTVQVPSGANLMDAKEDGEGCAVWIQFDGQDDLDAFIKR